MVTLLILTAEPLVTFSNPWNCSRIHVDSIANMLTTSLLQLLGIMTSYLESAVTDVCGPQGGRGNSVVAFLPLEIIRK